MYVQYDYITIVFYCYYCYYYYYYYYYIIINITIKTHIKININLKIKHALNSVLSNKSWKIKFPQTLNFNISHLLQQ